MVLPGGLFLESIQIWRQPKTSAMRSIVSLFALTLASGREVDGRVHCIRILLPLT